MDVYLIRHSAVAVEKGICYGRSDVALREDCQSQFETVKRKLEGIQPSLVYSSPAQRCKQMACYLSPSGKVIADERLRELNFGEWELKAWNKLPQEQVLHWTENFIHEAPPSGESYLALFNRVKGFWEEVIQNKNVESIIIITHGGVIRSILSYLLEIPLQKSFSLDVDLCGLSNVVIRDGFNTIKYVNK